MVYDDYLNQWYNTDSGQFNYAELEEKQVKLGQDKTDTSVKFAQSKSEAAGGVYGAEFKKIHISKIKRPPLKTKQVHEEKYRMLFTTEIKGEKYWVFLTRFSTKILVIRLANG